MGRFADDRQVIADEFAEDQISMASDSDRASSMSILHGPGASYDADGLCAIRFSLSGHWVRSPRGSTMSGRPVIALALTAVVSLLGTRLSMIAFPWLVLTTTGDPLLSHASPWSGLPALSAPSIAWLVPRLVWTQRLPPPTTGPAQALSRL